MWLAFEFLLLVLFYSQILSENVGHETEIFLLFFSNKVTGCI